MIDRPVVITGLGAAVGTEIGADAVARRCGFTNAQFRGTVAPGRESRHLDPSARMFCQAAQDAWLDAGLDLASVDRARAGLLEGSSLGPLQEAIQRLPDPRRPSDLVRFMTGAGGAAFACRYGLQGPSYHISAGSVSSMLAVIEACRAIARGDAEVMVAGGGEFSSGADVQAVFRAAGLLDPSGAEPCRPFDRRRAYTRLGDGAGAVVLESRDHAARRGRRAYVVIAGVGASWEGRDLVAPDLNGLGVARAVRQAMAGFDPEAIGWVKAHGTGTRQGDAAESNGLAAALGRRAITVPIVALKPLLGHCLGASGALELVTALLAIEAGVLPPSPDSTDIDPALPVGNVVAIARSMPRGAALLLSEGFGGRNAALVLDRAA